MKTEKILIFGFTKSAIEISSQLKAKGYNFTLIDNDASLLPQAEKLGFNLKILDYTDDILLEEGIGENVNFIFTLFDDDAKNVFLILSVKALDPSLHVIAITHTKDAIHKLEIAGASTILDPYQISGKKIYKLITQPDVMNVIDATVFGYHDLNMEQITITENSPLNHHMINDIYPNEAYNFLLVGIHDKELKKEFIFITEGFNHKLDAGDILVVIGQTEEILRYKKDFSL
ncbi:MAG: NAD-binding protein [Sulfurospirillaceae bacterium]|jgi:voltage-gated potassium channel|nr:NAD-binding protein [Sulfurospirillaceae bacterium]MDD2826444.1 NAD-binding protein [Sulfurospirillaceae bacterium]